MTEFKQHGFIGVVAKPYNTKSWDRHCSKCWQESNSQQITKTVE